VGLSVVFLVSASRPVCCGYRLVIAAPTTVCLAANSHEPGSYTNARLPDPRRGPGTTPDVLSAIRKLRLPVGSCQVFTVLTESGCPEQGKYRS